MFFRYTRSLEAQIVDLKHEINRLQERNDRLMLALVPSMRKQAPEMTATDILNRKKPHSIDRSDSGASCTCGWHVISNDPSELQNLIAEHFREYVKTVKGTRKSWPEVKLMVESAAEPNTKES